MALPRPPVTLFLAFGEEITIGHYRLGRCPSCLQIIRINKPIVGSLHRCHDPDWDTYDAEQAHVKAVRQRHTSRSHLGSMGI